MIDRDPARPDDADLPALRDALAELAEDAPRQLGTTDLWAAGRRRAPRTDGPTVLLTLAVAASVLLCAFVGWAAVQPTRLLTPAAQHPDGALPAVLHAAPARLTGPALEGGRAEQAVTDLAIGRTSVVWVDTSGTPVAVDATDGEHRLLDLPGWDPARGRAATPAAVELSPDGWQLAYAWADAAETTTETTAGLAVVDLRTGQVRRTELKDGQGGPLALTAIRWSPDGTWVAWYGDAPEEFTTSALRHGGRGHTGTTRSDDLGGGRFAQQPDGTGTGGVVVDDRGRGWPGGQEESDAPVQLRFAAIAPDGRHLASGGDRWLVRSTDGSSSWVRRPVARGDKEPLGWTSAQSFVGLANPPGTEQLLLTEVRVEQSSVSEGQILADWTRPSSVGRLSVATGLVTHGVVEFAEPRWPWSSQRKAGAAALATLGVLVGVGAVLVLRRRRRLARP